MVRRIALVAVSLIVVTGVALAQEKSETKNQSGTVKALTADSITVTDAGKEWTFMVDKDTQVIAKGASHKMKEAKEAGKTTEITDFVKEKQSVTVKYHDMGGGKLHAAEVRVK